MHGIPRINDTGRLIRKVNTRPGSETEQLLIGCKIRYPHLHGNLHQGIVAGIDNRILQRLVPMTVNIITVNPCVGNKFIAIAVKMFPVGYRSDLKGGSHCDRLNNRPRLVTGRYAKIAPALIQRVAVFLIRHSLDLCSGVGVRKIIRIIQVEFRVGRHGQDLPVIGIHHKDSYVFSAFAV